MKTVNSNSVSAEDGLRKPYSYVRLEKKGSVTEITQSGGGNNLPIEYDSEGSS